MTVGSSIPFTGRRLHFPERDSPDENCRLHQAGAGLPRRGCASRKDGRWIDEEDLPFAINESDEVALEEALQIAEKQGGEVIVFSLGPERVREALRKALALGRRAGGAPAAREPSPAATPWRPDARSRRRSGARSATWC